tara:strand:- start:305 stop:634 length:330 start_codon:yes stop_codon:yes gene_type:complete
MTPTQSLIANLEFATEGSRELDADVHNLIFGWRSDRATPIPHIGSDPDVPPYTTSLDAAVSLIDALGLHIDDLMRRALYACPEDPTIAQLAIALTIAALRAREVNTDDL